jgi:hypothetical protein
MACDAWLRAADRADRGTTLQQTASQLLTGMDAWHVMHEPGAG